VQNSELKSAADFVPARKTLPVLREAVQSCRGCDLYRHATQAVAGEGPQSSRIVFIGEQPGIDRSAVYVTNAVKHFKFEERGKRRIHKKPSASESRACRPWLEAELAVIHPEILVCLGATAAQSVFGSDYRVTKERGQFIKHRWAPQATSTIHPSAILRAPNEQRHIEYQRFVEDLKKVKAASRPRGRSVR
jgi:uracil-DNA glycosylase